VRQSNEIVDLHQVDDRGAQQLSRAPHLLVSRAPGLSSTPWSRENSRGRAPDSASRSPVTALGPAIHRRGIDDPAAIVEQPLQHLAQGAPSSLVGANVESAPSAEPNDGHCFAG